MEDFVLDLMIDSGPNARSVQVTLNKFTLAAATTRLGLLTEPLRTRFAFTSRLDYYDAATLETIILRTARILNILLWKREQLSRLPSQPEEPRGPPITC